MIEMLSNPWPWWVTGPLIGAVVPLLLWAGGEFGLSANLRHICAAVLPTKNDFFVYDWRSKGLWNLTFAVGVVIGGFLGGILLASPDPVVAISEATTADLQAMGVTSFEGLAPAQVFSGSGLMTLPGFVLIVVGGLLVGFGTRYAGGCTSGHAISGLANLQLPSLVAVLGFFAGGLIATSRATRTEQAQRARVGAARPLSGGGLLIYLLIGIYFGLVLTKGEVVSWFRIQEMFRFQAFHMYGIIGGALAVAMVSIALIKIRRVRTALGDEIVLSPKQMGRGYRYWIGGTIFGLGWAMTGACPGPIFALIGTGMPVYVVALVSAVAGTWLYGALRTRLPHY
jgi:uncharacterized membrane protein YedE/YeeE